MPHQNQPPKLRALLGETGTLIDVRSPVDFRDGHLPNAVNMTLRQLTILQSMQKDTPFVICGNEADASTVRSAINYLTLYGFTRIYSVDSTGNRTT